MAKGLSAEHPLPECPGPGEDPHWRLPAGRPEASPGPRICFGRGGRPVQLPAHFVRVGEGLIAERVAGAVAHGADQGVGVVVGAAQAGGRSVDQPLEERRGGLGLGERGQPGGDQRAADAGRVRGVDGPPPRRTSACWTSTAGAVVRDLLATRDGATYVYERTAGA
jgi:hypothetical protein